MDKIKEAIELIQDAKRSVATDKNHAAALSALNAATDILANIEETEIAGE